MHREISHVDEAFHPRSQAGLYLLTGLIGLLIALHLGWSYVAGWINSGFGMELPPLGEGVNLFGLRITIAFVAVLIGGMRVVISTLEGLAAGRVGADLALTIAIFAAIYVGEPLVAAEVIFIGLFGECLEAFTFDRTQHAIRRLVEVCPRWCLVLRDGQ